MSREELSKYGVIFTDEQWEEAKKVFAEISNKIWDEDHPLDE